MNNDSLKYMIRSLFLLTPKFFFYSMMHWLINLTFENWTLLFHFSSYLEVGSNLELNLITWFFSFKVMLPKNINFQSWSNSKRTCSFPYYQKNLLPQDDGSDLWGCMEYSIGFRISKFFSIYLPSLLKHLASIFFFYVNLLNHYV